MGILPAHDGVIERVWVCTRAGSVTPTTNSAFAEDAVPTGPNEAAQDYEDYSEDYLPLDELDDANDNENRGDDPEEAGFHIDLSFFVVMALRAFDR